MEEINYFGLTSFRNQKKKFGIKTDDRRRHFYVIGKTGMGKSNMMENMAIQDIQSNRGIAYIDPHGEGAEKLLHFVPSNRINDVVFLNPADLDYPIAFNVMEKVDFRYRHLVAGGLMSVFKKVWPDVWSARMEYILNNSILALLEYPDATLLGVNRMLADPDYREKVVSKITDPIVKSFWTVEFAKYSQRYEQEATAAIQNKVGQFISNPLIRNIIGQTKSTINMREIMDQSKILIMDLSKGRIGEDNSSLLGMLLITKLQLAAMSRVDIPENDRKDFYMYVDEFQNFATESFASILSEARKYRLSLILGHQYINQMTEEVRDAVFGNVGTLAVFRVGAEDAEFLEKEFMPEFLANDIVNLAKYNIYLKLMIDGVASHPFSAETLPPPPKPQESNESKIIKASRERYGVKREIVEEKIQRWTNSAGNDSKVKPAGNQQTITVARKPASNFVPQEGQSQLFDAICSNCGKKTKVIFEPTPGRTIYCKSCLKKMKTAEEAAKEKKKEEKQSQGQSQNQTQIQKPVQNQNNFVKRDNFERRENREKITNIDFSHKQNNYQRQENSARREINLAELRKALAESVERREAENKALAVQSNTKIETEKQEKNLPAIISPNVIEQPITQPTQVLQPVIPSLSPEQELQKRIEEEKVNDQEMKNSGVINPGQTIKF